MDRAGHRLSQGRISPSTAEPTCLQQSVTLSQNSRMSASQEVDEDSIEEFEDSV